MSKQKTQEMINAAVRDVISAMVELQEADFYLKLYIRHGAAPSEVKKLAGLLEMTEEEIQLAYTLAAKPEWDENTTFVLVKGVA